MSPRTTRSLALGLVSSAILLSLFATTSESEDEQKQQTYASGDGHRTAGSTHRSHYYRSRPWFGGWGYSSFGPHYSGPHYSGSRSFGAPGRSSTHSPATSRGGFGGIGSGHSVGG